MTVTKKQLGILQTYCWWKKSCTTWNGCWNLVNNLLFTTSTVDHLISKTNNPNMKHLHAACSSGSVACDTQWNPFIFGQIYRDYVTPFITIVGAHLVGIHMKNLRCFLGNFSLISKLTTIPRYQLSQCPKAFANAKKRSGPHLDVTT